ncbi:MAG: hypothetical protein OEX12_05810 [Gammaproteobacteria bacterium]|nr:hypothetical protein [Gammaproteobacteria bacterium]
MAKSKPSPERLKELEDWVKQRLWPIWDKTLTPPSDSRKVFLNYIIRDNPTDAFLEDLERHIRVQVKFWKLKKQADGRVIGACNLSTWYNAGRWDDEFIDEATSDIKERIAGKSCKCGNEVIGERFVHCHNCLPDPQKKLKYEALGEYKKRPDESVEQWRQRNKDYIRGKLSGLIKGLSGRHQVKI